MSGFLGEPIYKNVDDVIKLPAAFLIVASKFSGKTSLLKCMMYDFIKKKEFDWGVIISSTAKVTGEWDIIPKKFILSSYSDKLLENIYAKQEEFKKQKKDIKCFILMDDSLGTVDFKSLTMLKMVTTFRHFGGSIFIVSQYLKSIPISLRDNFDYTIVFKVSNMKILKDIYEESGIYWGTYYDFLYLMINVIKDFKALVIVKKTSSTAKEDIYFTIKAPDPSKLPKFFLKFNHN